MIGEEELDALGKASACLIPILPFCTHMSLGQGEKEKKRFRRQAVYFQLPFVNDYYMPNTMFGLLHTLSHFIFMIGL